MDKLLAFLEKVVTPEKLAIVGLIFLGWLAIDKLVPVLAKQADVIERQTKVIEDAVMAIESIARTYTGN